MKIDEERVRKNGWTTRYGEKFRFERVQDFPQGIIAPRKVRVYRRSDHYLIQWWEPGAKKNRADRVDGDLVAAIIKAREIEERLENFQSSGASRRKLSQKDLIDDYLVDLGRRVEADEISWKTKDRYETALRHYRAFVEQLTVEIVYSSAMSVDRKFAQDFQAFLLERNTWKNGESNGTRKPLKSIDYVLDVVRAMFEWARDPHRGHLMPDGFRNPFVGLRSRSQRRRPDLFGEPDITSEMAIDFIGLCDSFQLRLFGPLILYGLRASEPCYVFREDLKEGLLKVIGRPSFDYDTKGLRDKTLPLVKSLSDLLTWRPPGSGECCFVFPRRYVFEGEEKPALKCESEEELIRVYQEERRKTRPLDAKTRLKIRNRIQREAGGISYDQIQGEFAKIARALNWPRAATLKDFRHLFSTSLENSGVPLFYRRYLMGQSPGKSAVVTYTHINELRKQYQLAIDRSLKPIVEAMKSRMKELKLI